MTRQLQSSGQRTRTAQAGFTLIELLVATALAGVVTTAIYTVYSGSMRTYETRSTTVRMEANLRAALDLMTRELRMARFTPVLPPGFAHANDRYLPFLFNGRTLAYRLNDSGRLARKVDNGTFMPLADDIEALEFLYLLDDGTGTIGTPDYTRIRGVTISLLARTATADVDFRSPASYPTPGGQTWGPFADGHRRSFRTTTVYCRNTGP